ncbi:predicted protein [Histoplasma capsulatum G186AR]|uniref:Uncharacterized protein n=1 Tax=Ajellomyces capsulatus (strain G186AR / H82 / ATCC MYA-2454 / RMSCC 2432) TaxID=447093 RepID=C0NP43_AJECG|nr:uncharacterized protein HCBG_04923 [Histoplasma capsulatum G186AR]EEH06703.1 predicted protein [Histoplasma capsulatum G186AR]
MYTVDDRWPLGSQPLHRPPADRRHILLLYHGNLPCLARVKNRSITTITIARHDSELPKRIPEIKFLGSVPAVDPPRRGITGGLDSNTLGKGKKPKISVAPRMSARGTCLAA